MTFSLCIAAELKHLETIRQFIEERAAALGLDSAAIPDVVLATDEAVTNIILHGYWGRPGIIEIELERCQEALVIRLRDYAEPFDPTTVPLPDLSLPPEERGLGGLGVYLMRQVMDEIYHQLTPQGYNELTMVKRITKGASHGQGDGG